MGAASIVALVVLLAPLSYLLGAGSRVASDRGGVASSPDS